MDIDKYSRHKPTVLYFSSIETLYDNHHLEC